MSETAEQREVRRQMAELLGPQLTQRLVVAAGPNPRTGSTALKKLIEDSLSDLTDKVVIAAGPNPRTGSSG